MDVTLGGLEWALVKGLMYGLVLLLTLWGAGAIVEWGIRMRSRDLATDKSRAEITLELPHVYLGRHGDDGTKHENGPTSAEVTGAARGR